MVVAGGLARLEKRGGRCYCLMSSLVSQLMVLSRVFQRGCAVCVGGVSVLLSCWPVVRLGWSSTVGTDGALDEAGCDLLSLCGSAAQLGWSPAAGVCSGRAAIGGALFVICSAVCR